VRIVGFSIDGEQIDLKASNFTKGFYAPETKGKRTVRRADGEALVVIEPRPTERLCEVEMWMSANAA